MTYLAMAPGFTNAPVVFKKTGAAVQEHPGQNLDIRWVGVDLNTTGHAVVAAEPESGKVLRLGKTISYGPSHSSKKCTKLYREGKLWKLSKCKNRERKVFRAALNTISRQVVSFAESLCSGIKLEKLFSGRNLSTVPERGQSEFSFANGSFLSLQRLVEKRARKRGIPVLYVDPANTSKRCSRCGGNGRRFRKRFECVCCGAVIHADVNAAFNIASTSRCLNPPFAEYQNFSGKKLRKVLTASRVNAGALPLPHCASLRSEGCFSFPE